MRVALVHDWLTGMRGGEKVLLSLTRLFPEAPIFTLLHFPGSVVAEIEARGIRTSFIQRLPGVSRHYRRYLPLFPAAIASFDLHGFDLVISSSHCVAKGARAAGGAFHVCYCHTPMRYVWDRFDDYFGPGRTSPLLRAAIRHIAEALRAWDAATASRVTHFIANSRHVARRIRRFYGRASTVIHPPVDTDFFTPDPAQRCDGEYDLLVAAFVPYKRVDLALEAYRGTGRRLLLVGAGPDERRLRAMAPPEARFLGRVDDEKLRDLYRGCRAVLQPSVEDFGIVPLEAMACGRPAVVFAEGGGGESVIPGKTGVVFHAAEPESLRAAVDSLSRLRFNIVDLRARAEESSRQVFESRLRRCISDVMTNDIFSSNHC
ncbi:MAG: glycosyltransferase [Vicinamibacteria bacterium]|nr:glycosyltransferase [Vicinamibacteria bacterium]